MCALCTLNVHENSTLETYFLEHNFLLFLLEKKNENSTLETFFLEHIFFYRKKKMKIAHYMCMRIAHWRLFFLLEKKK